VWIVALWFAGPTLAHADLDRAALLSLSGSVLKIEVVRVQGGFSLGTGVVVAPERVVTNCHVTRDALQINILRGGMRWPVVSQRSDVSHDLCVLRATGLQAKVIALGRTDQLRPGQSLMALGYTGGMEIQHSIGEVLALHKLDGGSVVQSTNWFSSGASGGGLFDDQLRLVGILTFRLRGAEAQYFAAPAEWLQTMLDVAGQDGDNDIAPDRSQQLAYWQRPAGTQPRFLKAAQLQREDRWEDLQALAEDWLRTDSKDPEPWYLMGVALARSDHLPEARHALECSLSLEPGFAAAKDDLARLNGRQPSTDAQAQIAAPCKSAQ
jgi:serine protease Do